MLQAILHKPKATKDFSDVKVDPGSSLISSIYHSDEVAFLVTENSKSLTLLYRDIAYKLNSNKV